MSEFSNLSGYSFKGKKSSSHFKSILREIKSEINLDNPFTEMNLKYRYKRLGRN